MAQEELFKGRYLRLTIEKKPSADGKTEVTLERVFCRNGISVIAVPKPGFIRLIHEKDWNTEKMRTKLVSAYREDGEEALACAKRELEEELGLVAGSWQHFSTAKTEGAMFKEQDFFIASDLSQGEAKPDANEEIRGHIDWSHAEVKAKVLEGFFGNHENAFAMLKYVLEN